MPDRSRAVCAESSVVDFRGVGVTELVDAVHPAKPVEKPGDGRIEALWLL